MAGKEGADRVAMTGRQRAAARRWFFSVGLGIEGFGFEEVGVDQCGKQHAGQEGGGKAAVDGIDPGGRDAGVQLGGGRQVDDMVAPIVMRLQFLAQSPVEVARAMAVAIHQAAMVARNAKGHQAAQPGAIEGAGLLCACAAMVRSLQPAGQAALADISLIGSRTFADVVQQAHGQRQCGGTKGRGKSCGPIADVGKMMRQRFPIGFRPVLQRMRIFGHLAPPQRCWPQSRLTAPCPAALRS
nr:hypothetical protein [Sphingobium sp. Z007]